MPLPADKSAWPPAEHTARYSRMQSNATWYGGDPAKLTDLYAGTVPTSGRGKLLGSAFPWFWGRASAGEDDVPIRMHVPVAQDIAILSSELCFADAPRFVVQPQVFVETTDEEGEVVRTVEPAHAVIVAATQERLDEILEHSEVESLLLAAGETSAVLGSVGIGAVVNTTGASQMPRLVRVDADQAVPEYQWGELVAVTFWRAFRIGDTETMWFHLERHTPGAIEHGLYKGTKGNLGERRPLSERPETAGITTDEAGLVPGVPEGAITAVSVPNMLPDPLDRGGDAGRSDFSPGTLQVFDAIDTLYSSLMRDVQDGQSKLLIAEYMTETRGRGEARQFDQDRHLFTSLKMQPGESGDAPITQVQFSIRVEEHLRAIAHLIDRALRSAGYNSDTENGQAGEAITATEFSGRAKRSLSTRDKKLRYWAKLEPLLQGLLALDIAYFRTQGIEALPVKIVFPEGYQTDEAKLAETAGVLADHKIASLEYIVEYLHPGWDEEQRAKEVKRLRDSAPADPLLIGAPGGNQPGSPLPEQPDEGTESIE